MTKLARALISVSDKTNLEVIVNYLVKNNVEIISTGGTYKAIKELTEQVIEISAYTGFPEIMQGRVKTLNPLIHGGILADRNKDEHLQAMQENEIKPIDLVIVNLYPFEQTVSRGTDFATAIENIDVGGPTMVRAAAKNHKFLNIITDPADYEILIAELEANQGATTLEFRQKMAVKAFARTASYDAAIYNWLDKETEAQQENFLSAGKLVQTLRYGENSHQQAALYKTSERGLLAAEQIQGKELSYNNLNDADSAYALVKEFTEPAAAIIKHANPCGVATAENLEAAFKNALKGDPVSCFGGIVALNRELDLATAEQIKPIFFEVIIAPAITDEATELLASKKNMRILLCSDLTKYKTQNFKAISGGVLVQDEDQIELYPQELEIVSKTQPTEQQLADLIFAFKTVKHVRSNAVLFANHNATIAIGAGQMSRVDSVRMASLKLADFQQENSDFSGDLVLASDAFFPFPDGLELAIKAGAKAIIQPGGSIRDAEVIAKADELGAALIFTKTRHFKH